MNLYQVENYFKDIYKGKNVFLDFDMNCVRQMEIVYSDGKPHESHHLEYQKVRVTVDGTEPVYVSIAPHRIGIEWKNVKEYISSCEECFKTQEPR